MIEGSSVCPTTYDRPSSWAEKNQSTLSFTTGSVALMSESKSTKKTSTKTCQDTKKATWNKWICSKSTRGSFLSERCNWWNWTISNEPIRSTRAAPTFSINCTIILARQSRNYQRHKSWWVAIRSKIINIMQTRTKGNNNQTKDPTKLTEARLRTSTIKQKVRDWTSSRDCHSGCKLVLGGALSGIRLRYTKNNSPFNSNKELQPKTCKNI